MFRIKENLFLKVQKVISIRIRRQGISYLNGKICETLA